MFRLHASCRCRSRRAFTRVDLIALVVIGVLSFASFGCPGMGAREAARKSACSSNLKQIGLALLQYETQFRAFPYGARLQSDSDSGDWKSDWGPSWWLGATSFTDGAWITRNFDYKLSECALTLDKNGNGAILDGYAAGFMNCPASPLSQTTTLPSGLVLPAPTYAAISGTVPDLAGIPIKANWQADWLPGVADANNPPQGPSPRCTQQANPEGTVAGNGMFPPNEAVTIMLVRDGASNTLMVGEQSDFGIDAKAGNAKVDIRSCGQYGAWLGLGNTGQQNIQAIDPTLPGTLTAYNCTSLAFPINSKMIQDANTRTGKQLQLTVPGMVGMTPQKSLPKTPSGLGANNGIQSAHSGGANVVFADNRVMFINDNIDFRILLYMCCRDDQRGFTPP